MCVTLYCCVLARVSFRCVTNSLSFVFVGCVLSVKSVSWSPDGQKIASGSWDKTVRIFDALTGAPLAVLEGHTDKGMVLSCVGYSM